MPKVLFWNVGKGFAESYLPALCSENDVDILILAEDYSDRGRISSLINPVISGANFQELSNPDFMTIRVYTKLNPLQFTWIENYAKRAAIYAYRSISGNDLIIAAAHLPSKLRSDDLDQSIYATGLRGAVERAEIDQGHTYSIVIGDLNMNPFEEGMTSFSGLHGVMDKAVARKISRGFASTTSSFFYNPMWSRLGDESTGPPGTYYYNSGGAINHYWNLFDQLLLRPSLIPHYEAGDLRIVTGVGDKSLLENGIIDRSISDHLPLFFELQI